MSWGVMFNFSLTGENCEQIKSTLLFQVQESAMLHQNLQKHRFRQFKEDKASQRHMLESSSSQSWWTLVRNPPRFRILVFVFFFFPQNFPSRMLMSLSKRGNLAPLISFYIALDSCKVTPTVLVYKKNCSFSFQPQTEKKGKRSWHF